MVGSDRIYGLLNYLIKLEGAPFFRYDRHVHTAPHPGIVAATTVEMANGHSTRPENR